MPLIRVSGFSFLQCLDTVGSVTGRAFWHIKKMVRWTSKRYGKLIPNNWTFIDESISVLLQTTWNTVLMNK